MRYRRKRESAEIPANTAAPSQWLLPPEEGIDALGVTAQEHSAGVLDGGEEISVASEIGDLEAVQAGLARSQASANRSSMTSAMSS